MTTIANHPLSPASFTPDDDRPAPSLRARVTAAGRHLTWLKPPYRTARNLAHWLYTARHRLSAGAIDRVHVGSGRHVREGWWNLDLIHFPGVNEIRDAARPWRHRNLRYVFCEHFIEHLTLHQGLDFLRHAGNALQPGGVIRLSTPNLTHVVLSCYPVRQPSLPQRLDDTGNLNASFHGYGHRFLYSAEFLRFVLENMGFERVAQFNFGCSDDPNLRDLECHGPFEIDDGIPNIITFEATRGERPIAPSPALTHWLQRFFHGDVYR